MAIGRNAEVKAWGRKNRPAVRKYPSKSRMGQRRYRPAKPGFTRGKFEVSSSLMRSSGMPGRSRLLLFELPGFAIETAHRFIQSQRLPDRGYIVHAQDLHALARQSQGH